MAERMGGVRQRHFESAHSSVLLIALTFAFDAAGAQEAPRQWTLQLLRRIDESSRPPVVLGATQTAGHLSAAVGPGGKLLVPQPQSKTLLVFDASGRQLMQLGREGSGPGEFRSMTFVGWIKDTIAVGDHQQRRVSYFDPDGKLIRTESDVLSGELGSNDSRGLIGVTRDGDFVVGIQSVPQAVQDAGTGVAELAFATRNRSGRNRDVEFFRTRFNVPLVRVPLGGGKVIDALPHVTDVPLRGVSPNGEEVVVVDVPFPNSTSGEFSVRRFDLKSLKGRAETHSFVAQRVRPAAIDSFVEQLAAQLTRAAVVQDPSSLKIWIRGAYTPPKWYPAFDKLVLGLDGSIWLRVAAHRKRWLVLDSRSRIVAWTELTGRLIAASHEDIWVIDGEEQGDPPSIGHYRIKK